MRFPSDEFDAAVAATCHGTASEELLGELTTLLHDDAAALDEYLWRKEIHSRLATGHEFFVHELLRVSDTASTSEVPGERDTAVGDSVTRRWPAIAGLAALALALVAWWSAPMVRDAGVAAKARSTVPEMFVAAAEEPVVATIAEVENVGWVRADVAHLVGDTIRAGVKLEMATGRLRLDFRCGASVWLTGPAIFETESPQSGRLTAGRVQVVASTPEAKGFTIHTRTASFVDQGTEFTAEATLDGRCRVGVTSGEVHVQLASGSIQHLLKAGDVMEVEPGAGQVMARIESGDDSPAFRFPSIEPPSDDDYADRSRGEASIACVQGTLYEGRKSHSGPPELLLDGRGQSQPDAPAESVYFARGEPGCLLLDLGRSVAVTKVNAYSWHRNMDPEIDHDDHVRATQKYDLYGFDGDEPPAVGESPAASGWKLVARVNTDSYFGRSREFRPAQQATSITAAGGTLGRFRYLLWIMKPTKDEARPGDAWAKALDNTFFGEIDVYAD